MLANWALVILCGVTMDVFVMVVETPLPFVRLPTKALEALRVLVDILLVHL